MPSWSEFQCINLFLLKIERAVQLPVSLPYFVEHGYITVKRATCTVFSKPKDRLPE